MVEPHPEKKSDQDRSQIPSGINLIRTVYLFLAMGALFLLAILLAKKDSTTAEIINGLMYLSIYISVIFGIYKRKSWLVLLILLHSYWSVGWSFLYVMGAEVADTKILAKKLFQLMAIAFYIYQIFIFSKEETKQYYKEKKAPLI